MNSACHLGRSVWNKGCGLDSVKADSMACGRALHLGQDVKTGGIWSVFPRFYEYLAVGIQYLQNTFQKWAGFHASEIETATIGS